MLPTLWMVERPTSVKERSFPHPWINEASHTLKGRASQGSFPHFEELGFEGRELLTPKGESFPHPWKEKTFTHFEGGSLPHLERRKLHTLPNYKKIKKPSTLLLKSVEAKSIYVVQKSYRKASPTKLQPKSLIYKVQPKSLTYKVSTTQAMCPKEKASPTKFQPKSFTYKASTTQSLCPKEKASTIQRMYTKEKVSTTFSFLSKKKEGIGLHIKKKKKGGENFWSLFSKGWDIHTPHFTSHTPF